MTVLHTIMSFSALTVCIYSVSVTFEYDGGGSISYITSSIRCSSSIAIGMIALATVFFSLYEIQRLILSN